MCYIAYKGVVVSYITHKKSKEIIVLRKLYITASKEKRVINLIYEKRSFTENISIRFFLHNIDSVDLQIDKQNTVIIIFL